MSIDERWRHALKAVLDHQTDVNARREAEAVLDSFRSNGKAALVCMQGLLQHPCTEAEAQFLSSTLAAFSRKKATHEELAWLQTPIAEMLSSPSLPFSTAVKSSLASTLALTFIRGGVNPEDIIRSIFKQLDWTLPPPPLLSLLRALSEETTNKKTSMIPERRSHIITALQSASDVADFFANALRSWPFFEQAVSALEEWSSTFGPPPGLEVHMDILVMLSSSVFLPPVSRIASSCLCSLFTPSDGTPTNEALLQSLLSQWHHASSLSFLASLSLSDNNESPLDGSDWLQEEVVLISAAQVLSAVSSTLCGYSSCNQHRVLFLEILAQLIALVGCSCDDVALIATTFFSDHYLPSLESHLNSRPSERDVIISQHSHMLQALAEALIYRSRLKTLDASQATADARDIGDDAKNVRRELTSTLKAIGKVVGHLSLVAFVLTFSEREFNKVHIGVRPWMALEACLYAANVCVGCWLVRRDEVDQDSDDSDNEKTIQASNGQAPPQDLCGEGDAAIAKLLLLASSCSNHGHGSAKLTGTSLTLIGGLSSWKGFMDDQYSNVLFQIQEAVLTSMKSSDPKLSRNGATAFQRLCSHEALAHHLMAHCLDWIEAIASCYREKGGLAKKAGPHEDASPEEIILLTLCHLACACEDESKSLGLLSSLTSPQIQTIQGAKTGFSDSISVCCSIDIISALISSCSGKGRAPSALGRHIWGSIKETIHLNRHLLVVRPILDSVGQLLSACIRSCLLSRNHVGKLEELSEAVDFIVITEPSYFFSIPGLTDLICICLEAHAACEGPLVSMDLTSNRLELATSALVEVGGREIMRQSSSAGAAYVNTMLITSLAAIVTTCLTKSRTRLFESSERLDLIASATVGMCKSKDAEGCRAALSWYELVFKTCYAPGFSSARAAAAFLRSWIESSGAGPRLLQGLYFAALTMPSVFILKISSSLQVVFCCLGADLFISWSQSAFLLPSPLPSPSPLGSSMPPWQGLKPETRLGLLQEMAGASGDLHKFKRIVKLLTGGKKKGEAQPSSS